ncbi:bacterio-opsin activator [Halobacteriales archaeon SW_7_71_33]|nr:MAG: bacterio-opsin activator [Halobacteriales archaeon SW_7_71_33]
MHAVRVALRIPEDRLHPMHAFVCESPTVDREVILERDARGELTTLLLYVDGDREEYEAAIADVPAVEEWTTESTDRGDGFHVYVRTRLRERERRYREALDRESVLVVPPVELRPDRTVRQTMTGHAAELSAAVEALPADVDVEVLRTGTYRRVARPAVTELQREALRAAFDVGYYDLPRSADLATVADALDCSTSAASDRLRRAERRLVAGVLGERR